MADIFNFYSQFEVPEYLTYTPYDLPQQNPTKLEEPESTNADRFLSLLASFPKDQTLEEYMENLPTFDVDSYINNNGLFKEDTPKQPNTHSMKGGFKSKEEFVNTFKPLIETELTKQGVDLSYTNLILSQMALESAWGSKPSGKNNFAGIKGSTGKELTTKEYINGRLVTVRDTFKNFDSIEDFVTYYIDRLKNKFNAFNEGDFLSNIKSKGYFTLPLNQYRQTFNLVLHNINKMA